MPKIVQDKNVYHVAMQAVIERGYIGATTKQIAAAADISEVTLFRKYGSKAELIKKAIASIGQQFDFLSPIHYTGDVAADLLRVVQAYQETSAANGQFYFSVLLEIPRQPELAEAIDTPLAMIERLGELLTRYQTEGILAQENPVHAVAALLGPLIITNLMHNAAPDFPLPAIDLSQHVAHFLDGRRLPSIAS
jgi:AcrR family transcriptional regulator